MLNDLLIHATGLGALALNAGSLLGTCERRLRLHSGVAGMAWALNNFLLGAHVAAALSVVGASRTATSAATLGRARRVRHGAFAAFLALTLAIALATWRGWASLPMTTASLMSTYAVFHMSGRPLRWAMLAISGLWMIHAWNYGSWEQMAANVLSAAAALVGAWRLGQAAAAAPESTPAPAR